MRASRVSGRKGPDLRKLVLVVIGPNGTNPEVVMN